MNDSRRQWLEAIRSMTATPSDAESYLDWRLQFTTSIAHKLTEGCGKHDALLYGVWLEEHLDPIYIGQSTEGRRRLWDLPIGESHHLANSFPPEIWARVVVVCWEELFAKMPAITRGKIEDAVRSELAATSSNVKGAIGLGLEYLMQRAVRPLFNRRKKLRNGSWRDVDWDSSSSVGAKVAPCIQPLFASVLSKWEELAQFSPSTDVTEVVGGRVAFPSKISGINSVGGRR